MATTRHPGADLRAWTMQELAPLTVRYGHELLDAGRDLPGATRVRLPTRHGRVRCAVWRPPGTEGRVLPAYVHLHGGAFVMRHPGMDDFWVRHVVATTGLAVVVPDYAVAPQVRYPVAHEQVHDLLVHLAGHGHELDLAESYDDKRPVGTPMLGPAVLDLVRATYFRDAQRRAEPYASPMRAADLAGLPPAMVLTGAVDLLRREGDAYAARLAAAGVTVEHRVVPGADHYFLSPANARQEMDRMADAVAARLAP